MKSIKALKEYDKLIDSYPPLPIREFHRLYYVEWSRGVRDGK